MNTIPESPRQGFLRAEALQALREAVWEVIQERKRHGMPVIVYRDGKVVHLPAEEAEAEWLAAKAREDAAKAEKPAAP